MRIERHVFGSLHGYSTLARSRGITDADCRLLESTSFGTSYDPTYRTSLQRAVAYLSRPLNGQRRAITRVLPGPPDDENRPTLLFITAVIAASDWDQTLQGDALALLRRAEVWAWDHSAAINALDLADLSPTPLHLSGSSLQRTLGLVSLVELSWLNRRIVVVQESEYSLEELVAVERLLPRDARQSYSAAYRSLNPDLGVRLNGVAAGVSASPRKVSGAKSPYAQYLEQNGIVESDGLLLDYAGFGQPKVRFEVSAEEDVPVVSTRPRPSSGPLLGLIAALALLVGGAAGWLSRQATLPPPTPAPEWSQVIAKTPALVATRTEDRAVAARELIETMNRIVPEESARTRASLDDRVKHAEADTQRIDETLRAIRAVRPGDSAASDAAQSRVSGIRDLLDPLILGALNDWAKDRRRPLEDRFDALAGAIRKRMSERVSGFDDVLGRTDEQVATEAQALAGAYDFLASVHEYRDALVGSVDVSVVRDSLRKPQSAQPDRTQALNRIQKVDDATKALLAMAEALKQSPEDEDAFKNAMSSLLAFADTQEENVRLALTRAAEAFRGVRDKAMESKKP